MSDEPAASPGRPPEQPTRYNRSFGGLIGAMVVTVAFVAAYVGFRAFFRDQPDLEPDVDYLACVAYLQEADVSVVHPQELPDGWHANGIHYESGTPPIWRLGLITRAQQFAGVVQQHDDLDDLLHTYVDDAPIKGQDAAPTNQLGITTWETWSDSGGDHAFSAEPTTGPLAGETLLVYGSASVADLETLVGSLTLDAVPEGHRSADCDTDQLQ